MKDTAAFVRALQQTLEISPDIVELARTEERLNEFMDGASLEEIEAFGEELGAFIKRVGMSPLDQARAVLAKDPPTAMRQVEALGYCARALLEVYLLRRTLEKLSDSQSQSQEN